MRQRRYRLALTLIAGLLAGCGLTAAQRDAAGTFSRAAINVGDFTTATFPAMRQSVIEMNTTTLELGGKVPANKLEENFALDAVAARVAAGQALSNYGTLLRALVEDTQEAEIKQASDNFVASVRNVPGNKLSDQQYQALGTLVQGIGTGIVEAKKASAVKEIATTVKDDIDHLCDLLAQDFTPKGLNLAHGFDDTRKRLASEADLALDSLRSLDDRARAFNAISQASAAQTTLDMLQTRAVPTVQQLKLANAALVSALNEEHYTVEDLRNASQQVQQLSAAVQTLAGK